MTKDGCISTQPEPEALSRIFCAEIVFRCLSETKPPPRRLRKSLPPYQGFFFFAAVVWE